MARGLSMPQVPSFQCLPSTTTGHALVTAQINVLTALHAARDSAVTTVEIPWSVAGPTPDAANPGRMRCWTLADADVTYQCECTDLDSFPDETEEEEEHMSLRLAKRGGEDLCANEDAVISALKASLAEDSSYLSAEDLAWATAKISELEAQM